MLRELLLRDLRLHRSALIIPLLLALGHLIAGACNRKLLYSIPMDLAVVAFLPMMLELREYGQGTLADLAALPISRREIVRLRYLEGLLATAAMIGFLEAGMAIVLRRVWHEPAALQILSGEYQLTVALILLGCLAAPLPIYLRWGLKGLGVAWGCFSVVSLILVLAMARLPQAGNASFAHGLERAMDHLATHPGQLILLFLALFAASYELSQRAFAARDL